MKESLAIVIYFTEDRVTTSDELDIPFSTMNSIYFLDVQLPVSLKTIFKNSKPICIKMKNGSAIYLSDTIFIKLDSTGNQIKNLNINNFDIKQARRKNQAILLMVLWYFKNFNRENR